MEIIFKESENQKETSTRMNEIISPRFKLCCNLMSVWNQEKTIDCNLFIRLNKKCLMFELNTLGNEKQMNVWHVIECA